MTTRSEAAQAARPLDCRVRNAVCPRCGGPMKPSKAIAQTWMGEPEWSGATICTMSPGGPGRLIDCLKCEKCGHSVSSPNAEVSERRRRPLE